MLINRADALIILGWAGYARMLAEKTKLPFEADEKALIVKLRKGLDVLEEGLK